MAAAGQCLESLQQSLQPLWTVCGGSNPEGILATGLLFVKELSFHGKEINHLVLRIYVYMYKHTLRESHYGKLNLSLRFLTAPLKPPLCPRVRRVTPKFLEKWRR